MLVLVCKRWKGVAENSKLWEDKKPGWIFVYSKRHLIQTVAEGGGGSELVRREPGVGGANLRRRLWILSQAEGFAVGD